MNTVNHAATGAIIGLAVSPVLALPLAFASHFAMDALPHNGYPGHPGYGEAIKHKWNSAIALTLDFIGLPIIIYALISNSWVVWLAAILAVSPDFKWPYRYLVFERKGLEPPKLDPISKFHQWIQWCERPWGIFIEVIFAVFVLNILWRLA